MTIRPNQAELISIYNPASEEPLDLSNYYITDSNLYYNLPSGAGFWSESIFDFIVRFPDGYFIQSGESIIIGISDNFSDHYEYLTSRLKEIEQKEIEGYIRRVKYLAPYEKSESDIAFYAKLENQKRAKDRINQLAEHKEGEIFTDQKNIIRIATGFYKDLYTPSKPNETTQKRLKVKNY